MIDRRVPAPQVGPWFSLGHSTVVFAFCLLMVVGVDAQSRVLAEPGSLLREVASRWGPVASGVFLLLIAGLNVVSLWAAWAGTAEAVDGARVVAGGPVWRVIGAAERLIDRPWRMLVVGFLFGLGFDTATEVGLIALAATTALGRAPWWALLALPILFAAGMSALDSAQGAVAGRVYRRRARHGLQPGRSRFGVVTLITVLAAVIIGGVELARAISDSFNGLAVFRWIGSIDISSLGVCLTVLLLLSWGALAWRTTRE